MDGALINSNNKEELLQLSSANLQLVVDEIRSISHFMISYHLHKHGLAFAIDSLFGNISKASPLRFQTKLQGGAVTALSTDQQLQVYRIIQEATNNILKHAAPALAEIILTRQNQLIYLVIKDNGKGFSMDRPEPGMGYRVLSAALKFYGDIFKFARRNTRVRYYYRNPLSYLNHFICTLVFARLCDNLAFASFKH